MKKSINELSNDEVINEIKRSIQYLLGDSCYTEIRALDVLPTHKTASGYFTNLEELSAAAADLTLRSKGVYFLPNPLHIEARDGRHKYGISEPAFKTTNDSEIDRREWLLIDADPIRPSGVSSTDAELEAAMAKVRCIREDLRQLEWPEPVIATSGNGGHLMYRVDLPADDGGLVQRVLQALALRYDDEVVQVDTSVYNPARIWKLYGTIARKGANTTERPHRQARTLWDESPESIQVVPQKKLEALAAPIQSLNLQHLPSTSPRFDLDAWIRDHQLNVTGPRPWNGGQGRKWIFRVCPWNSEHTDRSAYIAQLPGGAIAAGCHHNGCQGKGWRELRDMIEPGWQEKRNQFAFTDLGNAERLVHRPP
ncbi:MAG: hypothetical protein V2A56_05910 [bacterium]